MEILEGQRKILVFLWESLLMVKNGVNIHNHKPQKQQRDLKI